MMQFLLSLAWSRVALLFSRSRDATLCLLLLLFCFQHSLCFNDILLLPTKKQNRVRIKRKKSYHIECLREEAKEFELFKKERTRIKTKEKRLNHHHRMLYLRLERVSPESKYLSCNYA